MSITSYAQNFEDVMLWRALGYISNGFYIDVGAQHPINDSVSKAFYEHGWRGVHIEATTTYATLIRADRPDEVVLQVALSDKPGFIKFYEIPETGLSTGDSSIAEYHRSQGYKTLEVMVPSITLDDVFEQVGDREIHWLKIDVEGMETQVVAGWGTSTARPWVLVVESTYPNSQIETQQNWEGMLLAKGYIYIYFDGLSRFYVLADRLDLAQKLKIPPNIFDNFSLAISVPYNAPISANLQNREKNYRDRLANSENAAHQRLLTAQQELQHVQQEGAVHERLLADKHSQAKLEQQILLRTVAQREQAASSQLLTFRLQFTQELASLSSQHYTQVQALQSQHADSERSLYQQLTSVQLALQQQQQERIRREQEWNETNSQIQRELQASLENLVLREQRINAQLLITQTVTAEEKAELVQSHFEQQRVLNNQHAEREQALVQKLLAIQQELHWQEVAFKDGEKQLSQHIAVLQSETQILQNSLQLQIQQHSVESSKLKADHLRLTAAFTEIEADLKAKMEFEQKKVLQLRQVLSVTQQQLLKMHTSLTWRLTAPLRALIDIITGENVTNAPFLTELEITKLSKKTNLDGPLPIEEVALKTPYAPNTQHDFTDKNMSFNLPEKGFAAMTKVFSLDELLALQGTQFVNSSYQSLLGRAPDTDGLNHYISRMKSGIPKKQLIAEMASSQEAENRGINLAGLPKIMALYKRQKHPILGPFFRFSSKYQATSSIPGRMFALEMSIRELHDDSLNRLAILEKKIDDLFNVVVTIKNVSSENFFSSKDSTDHPTEKEQKKPSLVLGEDLDKYYFNLSTSHHWKAHPVGIIRVERELAKYLSKYKNVEFVLWNQKDKAFKSLRTVEVFNILSDSWSSPNSEFSNHNYINNKSSYFERNSTFISIGLDWDLCPVHEINDYINSREIKSVFACYDLIPILFPEYCVNPKFDQVFKRHFVEMGHNGKKVFVDSDNSKKDLEEFWADAALETELPSLKSIPLATYHHESNLPALNSSDTDIINHVKNTGDYVIYVSSFEARKNHRLLINIWRDLYEERGIDCPQLLIVGMKGWGVNDLLQQIPRMPAFKAGKINWLQGIGDDLLIHLYDNCKFSLFPSIYEGWGLAATEAMSFGKVCVISNNSALVQATQNIMPSFHPLDFIGWKCEIDKLLDDDSYRLSIEDEIKKKFKNRTWEDFSHEFCKELLIGK